MSSDPSILQMFDAYYTVPKGDASDYIDSLLDICKKEKVNILFPIMSVELDELSKHKHIFEENGTLISISPSESISIANDKLKLFDFMSKEKLPCAKYYSVSDVNELKKAILSMGYPHKDVCVKATNSSGSRGFRIIKEKTFSLEHFLNEKPSSCIVNLKDFLAYFDSNEIIPELLVMEYLPGTEYTVDLLADCGKTIFCGCRKSLSMSNSIMLDGIVVQNDTIKDLCKKIVEKLELDGNIGFDIKEDKDGNPLILECNPRITAGISIFKAAGINLPYLAVKKMLGEPIPDLTVNIGTMMKRRYLEMYY